MTNGDLIPPSPHPASLNGQANRLTRFAALVVLALIVIWVGYWGVSKYLYHRALTAETTISFVGLVADISDVALHPLDDRVAVHATARLLDRTTNRRVSEAGIHNSMCAAFLASDMIQIDAGRVFRVTFHLQAADGSELGNAIVGVDGGNCAVHMLDGQQLYTMPEPLNGWILKSWMLDQLLPLGGDRTLELTCVPRVDSDPALLDFDLDFACRVVFADWPIGVPEDGIGRDWTHVKITARTGPAGTWFSFGRYLYETYEIGDPRCAGEQV